MARSDESAGQSESFQGALAGLTLSEAIELNAVNRVSGCLKVEYGGSIGLIFFREGEIVHAEQGGKSGVEAFCDILEWRAKRFSLEANMASTRRTIQMNAQALLSHAQKVVEDRRSGGLTPPPLPGPGNVQRDNAAALLEKLKRIPGVAYVVLTSKDGTCVADGSLEGETLAGQAAYLSMGANHLGTIFRAGAVHSVVVQGASQNLLLLAGKNHNLSLLIRPEAQVRVVEAEVRKVLTSAR